MLKVWDIKDKTPLSLQELIDFFERRGPRPLSNYDLDEAALMMSRFFNRRHDICAYLVQNASQILRTSTADDYTPDAIVLHRTPHFFVRIVFWLPNGTKGHSTLTDGVIHDHNFNLLTLGLLGSGYETEVWQYHHQPSRNQVGELVEVNHQGLFQLEEGRVFFFEKNVDIHRQISPSDFSVSLNIIETNDQDTRQYDFSIPSIPDSNRFHVSTLLNPPLLQQLSSLLSRSPLREEARLLLELTKQSESAECV